MKYEMNPNNPTQFIYESVNYLTQGDFDYEDITGLDFGNDEVLPNHIYVLKAHWEGLEGRHEGYHLFMKDNSSKNYFISIPINYADFFGEDKWMRMHIGERRDFGKLYESWSWALLVPNEPRFINWRDDPFEVKS